MKLLEALFLERLNRFVVKVKINEKIEFAYLPNPGRLWELLLPGRPLLLTKNLKGKYPYTVIACKLNDYPVLLHTHLTNHYIIKLLEKRKLPFFNNFKLLKKEPMASKGRLDLLLEDPLRGTKLYLEIKTCTLFGEKLAMFPDAETQRGTKHLYELLNLKEMGYEAACIFAVMSPEVKYFLPAYHIDPNFTKAFLETYGKIQFEAFSIRFSSDLEEIEEIKRLIIPIEFLKQEFGNSGAYLIIFQLNEDSLIEIGSLGKIEFKKGFYIYVGSGRRNLRERVKRHLTKKNKKKKWHIDYFSEKAELFKAITIVSSEKLECLLARDLLKIADNLILSFGSSDCECPSHLFYFKENPLYLESFIKILNYYRLERPVEKLEKTFMPTVTIC